MEPSKFFDYSEGMVTDVFAEKGGWRDMAVVMTQDGKLDFVPIGDSTSDTDAAARLAELLEQRRLAAYAVAFEAMLVGSEAEIEAMESGRVQLDLLGKQAERFEDIPTEHDPDLPERVLFIFMAARSGERRAVVFPILTRDGRKALGFRDDEVPDEMETPYRNLFERR